MDKNTVLGLVLMGLIVFGFSYFNRRDAEQRMKEETEMAEKQQQAEADAAANSLAINYLTPQEADAVPALVASVGKRDESKAISAENPAVYTASGVSLSYDGSTVTGQISAAGKTFSYNEVATGGFADTVTPEQRREATEVLRNALTNANRYGAFARHLSGEEKGVVLANDKLEIEVNTHGGDIGRATLLNYFNYLPNPETGKTDTTRVDVWQRDQAGYNFILTSATQRFDTSTFYFTPETPNDSTLVMKLDLGEGRYWGYRYTLAQGSYIVNMDIVQNGMDEVLPPSMATVEMNWHQHMGRNEEGRTFEDRNSGLYYKYVGDSPDDLSAQGHQEKTLNQSLKWIAFKNQFFSSVMIARSNFVGAEVSSTDLKDDPLYVKDLAAKATIDYSTTAAEPVSISIFFGPNLYPLLSDLDHQFDPSGDTDLDLTRLIPLGWPIFRWINTLIIIPVFTFLSKFISSYGLIIFLLTIFIKLILFPLSYKSLKSQARMRVLAPEIKEINEKYPGQENAMVRNQKTMELYSKAGASPFSGCLPMLLQMPILIAMFWFFPSCIELRGESFLWVKNLAAPDYILTLPFAIPWYGNKVSLFCLLMTITNVLYTRINMQNQPSSSSMPGMKWMMYLMPVMFLFIFNDYAAGLSYYYFLSLLITILMNYIFRAMVDDRKVREEMKARAAKPRKKSGFMARLEEAQRQQQAMLREQQKKNNNSKGRR